MLDRKIAGTPLDGSYDGWYDTPGLVLRDLAGGSALAGTLTAHGPKPHFAYQVKLEGKATEPRLAVKGRPRLYDLTNPVNWANEQIGSLGRWWCNACAAQGDLANVTDAQLTLHRGHVILGYLLFDFSVTDADGAIVGGEMPASLDSSFHVLWKDPGVNQRAWTSADGRAILKSPKLQRAQSGTFIRTIVDVAKDGWTYAAPSPPPSGQISFP